MGRRALDPLTSPVSPANSRLHWKPALSLLVVEHMHVGPGPDYSLQREPLPPICALPPFIPGWEADLHIHETPRVSMRTPTGGMTQADHC